MYVNTVIIRIFFFKTLLTVVNLLFSIYKIFSAVWMLVKCFEETVLFLFIALLCITIIINLNIERYSSCLWL